MATQSTFYDLEVTDIRFFLSTKPIASKSHVAVWIKGDDDVYRIANESEYELINDNIVFPTTPSGKAIEIRVGDDPSDLVSAPTDIAIVSAIANEIVIVADSVQDVITVSENISQVTIVSTNMTELLVISTNIDQVLLSKEYAVTPEDVAITGNPTDFSSLHYSKKAEASAVEAQGIVDAVNFPAGLIMEWHSDRKPTGWLWCDGESYSVFSPTPSLAYDELYQVLVDPTYVMTLKPVDWDINYPDDPNGWYDPSFVGSVVTQPELDLLVVVPDRRGLFVRGKDQAGSVIPARGLDSHGVVSLDVVTPSQNKAHTHEVYAGIKVNDGSTDDSNSIAPDAVQDLTTTSEGGDEAHPTYGTTNYIIRAKGSYNGEGAGSGGTGVTPIASEIDYADTNNAGVTNLQDSTDLLIHNQSIKKIVGTPTLDITTEGSYQSADGIFTTYNQSLGSMLALEDGTIAISGQGASQNTRSAKVKFGVATDYTITDVSLYRYSVEPKFGHSVMRLAESTLTPTLYIKDYDTAVTLHTIIGNRLVTTDASITYANFLVTGKEVILHCAFNASGASQNGLFEVLALDGTVLASTTIVRPDPALDIIKASPTTDGGFVFGFRGNWYRYNGTLETIVSLDLTGTPILTDHFMVTQDLSNDKFYAIALQSNAKSIEVTFDDSGVATLVKENLAGKDMSTIYANLTVTQGKFVQTNMPTDKLTTYNIDTVDIDPAYTDAYSIEHNVGNIPFGEDGEHGINLSLVGRAKGVLSFVIGEGTKALRRASVAIGLYNIEDITSMFSVGIGTVGTPADGFVVKDDGDVQAPNRLAVPNAKSLLAKDIGDGLYHEKETGVSGSFTTVDGKTVTVTNGIITAIV